MQTARLEIRLPTQPDRDRFVALFGDPDFMVFSDGALDRDDANRRFDEMLVRAAELAFVKAGFTGEILPMIDPRNAPSQNVARKLGFAFWKQAVVNGYLDDIFRLELPRPTHA